MLTKKDLGVLETMFKDAKREITEQVTSQVIAEVVPQVTAQVVPQITALVVPQVTAQVTSQLISKVGEMLQRNTDFLVELITTGFNIQDAGFDKANKVLSNHEKRIGALEKTIFKTN